MLEHSFHIWLFQLNHKNTNSISVKSQSNILLRLHVYAYSINSDIASGSIPLSVTVGCDDSHISDVVNIARKYGLAAARTF